MKAAVYLGDGEVRIEDRPTPEPGPGEVLVAMRACGICGSDLMEWYLESRVCTQSSISAVTIGREAGAGWSCSL